MIEFLAARADGDARAALNALELACSTATGERVTLADAEDAMQRKAVLYDKGGDQHYDYISAWIKSTRGSDPDASLYYLAAMLEGGEDARFIARRMIILASEDVGNADPQALPIAVAAAQAVEHVGPARGVVRARPGGDLPVAGAEVGRRSSARSAPCAAHRRARRRAAARRAPVGRLPGRRQRSAAAPATTTRTTIPGHVNDQEHLPEGLGDLRFYHPDDAEADMRERLERIRRARGVARRTPLRQDELARAAARSRPAARSATRRPVSGRERHAEHSVAGGEQHALGARVAADRRQAVRRARPQPRPREPRLGAHAEHGRGLADGSDAARVAALLGRAEDQAAGHTQPRSHRVGHAALVVQIERDARRRRRRLVVDRSPSPPAAAGGSRRVRASRPDQAPAATTTTAARSTPSPVSTAPGRIARASTPVRRRTPRSTAAAPMACHEPPRVAVRPRAGTARRRAPRP